MRLIIEDDEGHKTVVPFQREEITIGREEGNTIRLTERNVSRRHARLLRVDGGVRVEDLSSYNGIRVNGERVHGSREIHAGDVMQVGDYDVALERDVQPEASPALGMDDTSPSISLSPPPPPPAPHPAPRNLVREIRQVPESERPRLNVLGVPSPGREFVVTKTVVQIGRAPECDISVDHASLARGHAQLVREGDSWMVLEASSLHAVRVNGEPCAEAFLRDGDVVTLGDVEFRFVAPGASYAFVPEPQGERTRPSLPPLRRTTSRRALILAIVGSLVLLAALAALIYRSRVSSAPVLGPRVPEVLVAPPSPPPGPQLKIEAGSHDLAEAEKELDAGHFGAALQAAERAAASGQADRAAPVMERIRAEESAQKAVVQARAALDAGKLDQALELVASIASPSASAAAADEIRARAAEPFEKTQLGEARRLQKTGRIPEALVVLDEALQRLPGSPDLTSERARIASLMPPLPLSNTEQAKAAFDEGMKLAAQNQCKQAVTFLNRAVLLMPNLAEAHKQLGSCYAQLRDGEQAALHYRKLLDLQPENPSAPAIRRYLDGYQQNMAATPEAQGSP